MENRLIHSLRHRMQWSIANRILKSLGAPTGRGWDKTEEKLSKFRSAEVEEMVLRALHEHVLCGEKFTKFYRAAPEAIDALRSKLLDLEPTDSAFLEHYPMALSEGELSEIQGAPKLCEVVRSDDGIGVVYCSMIRLTTREEIDLDEFFEDVEEIESRYDEIVGYKFRPVQLFNIILLPHHYDFIEVRTDYPDGMPQDVAHVIQSQMKGLVNQLAKDEIITHPLDLFPLVRSMYEDNNEGEVVELGFGTTTASIKNEKMRRAKLCLRDEIYHKAGKEALDTPINPFRISIRWYLEHDGFQMRPELSLHGTSKGQHTIKQGEPAAQVISAARITNCAGIVDYEHVKGRVAAHLANHLKRTAEAES